MPNTSRACAHTNIYIQASLANISYQGPIHFQKTVREEVMKHRKKEEQQGGRPIWPAEAKIVGEMKTGKLSEEELFCSRLEAANCTANSDLAW